VALPRSNKNAGAGAMTSGLRRARTAAAIAREQAPGSLAVSRHASARSDPGRPPAAGAGAPRERKSAIERANARATRDLRAAGPHEQ